MLEDTNSLDGAQLFHVIVQKVLELSLVHKIMICSRPGVTGRNFPPVSFFPGEKPGRPILSPGKKLTSQFFPHPVSFFPPYIFL